VASISNFISFTGALGISLCFSYSLFLASCSLVLYLFLYNSCVTTQLYQDQPGREKRMPAGTRRTESSLAFTVFLFFFCFPFFCRPHLTWIHLLLVLLYFYSLNRRIARVSSLLVNSFAQNLSIPCSVWIIPHRGHLARYLRSRLRSIHSITSIPSVRSSEFRFRRHDSRWDGMGWTCPLTKYTRASSSLGK